MYNPLFPQNYQPINYNQMPNYGNSTNYNQQSNNQSVIWVQGIEGAKAHYVPAGGTALLMDSDGSYMYIKTADQSGMPTMRTFRYEEVTGEEKPQVDMSQYVTREELEKALAGIRKGGKKHESSVSITK